MVDLREHNLSWRHHVSSILLPRIVEVAAQLFLQVVWQRGLELGGQRIDALPGTLENRLAVFGGTEVEQVAGKEVRVTQQFQQQVIFASIRRQSSS